MTPSPPSRSRSRSIPTTSTPTTLSGRAYWQERKYDDAVTAFNKQIEINPLDKFAHANLGAMYSEWHKYDLAVPELEKAASLTPDNPELQVSLGDAYLNLGQDDKALATFDHAVELSATPLVWNNIAYQLSLKKAHLDRAQQYAESAVSATAAALRNVSLDRLTPQDLAPGSIAHRLLGHAGLGLLHRRQSRQGREIRLRRLGTGPSRRSRRPSRPDLRKARRERSRLANLRACR